MKQKMRRGLVIGALLLMSLSFIGCEALAGILSAALVAPDATVEDMTGAAISGAEAVLTIGGVEYKKTSSDTGYVFFSGAPKGSYSLTATKTGYYFSTVTGNFSADGQNLGKIKGSTGIKGTLINARVKDEKIGGATVDLWSGTTKVDTATSDATTGVFTFQIVNSGTYVVKAAKATTGTSGYAFIDKTVEIASTTSDLGNVIGFSYDTTLDASTISIVSMWTKTMDVDSHITYPLAWSQHVNTFAEPYATAGIAGFDADGSSSRGWVRYGAGNTSSTATVATALGTGTDTRPCVQLDVDDLTGANPETITIREIPFDWYTGHVPTYGISPDSANLLPTGSTYSWEGVMEYYVNAFSLAGTATLSDEGASGGSNLVVYIIQGSSVKGRFVIPDYMTVKTASLIRINLFGQKVTSSSTERSFYQLVPDIRLSSSTTYKGFGDGIPTNTVINLEGNAR